jgi:hypothetical protein
VTAEIQGDPTLARELVARLLGPQMGATIERLRVAQDAGQVLPGADLSIGVELLYGPIFHRWLLRTAPLSEPYADTVVGMALAAMRSAVSPSSQDTRALGVRAVRARGRAPPRRRAARVSGVPRAKHRSRAVRSKARG